MPLVCLETRRSRNCMWVPCSNIFLYESIVWICLLAPDGLECFPISPSHGVSIGAARL